MNNNQSNLIISNKQNMNNEISPDSFLQKLFDKYDKNYDGRLTMF